MDGVLCDFLGKIEELYGVPFKSSMWNDISANHPNIYRELKPFQNMVNLANELSHRFDVKVLTAQPSLVSMSHCTSDKLKWCSQHLNANIEVIITSKAFDKQLHSTYQDIIVDDSNINIEQWVARGGIGIHHTSHDLTQFYLNKLINGE